MIVVVDSGVANLGSIVNMLRRIGAAAEVSKDPNVIEGAEKLILPGVGAFDAGMRSITERGLIPALNTAVVKRKTPILGLCLGMQMFTRRSEEGGTGGLGWIDAETVRFSLDVAQHDLKVPHMGWNRAQLCRQHPLFDSLEEESRFYFVHSYHVVVNDPDVALAMTTHGYAFPSVIAQDNIVGVQFHPEKSHRYGMRLFQNFVERM